jgi:hypothetical protein
MEFLVSLESTCATPPRLTQDCAPCVLPLRSTRCLWVPPASPPSSGGAGQWTVTLTGQRRLWGWAKVWLPGRKHVVQAIETRMDVHPSGEIFKLPCYCPWKSHLYELEPEMKVEPPLKFCLYEVRLTRPSWHARLHTHAERTDEDPGQLVCYHMDQPPETHPAKVSLRTNTHTQRTQPTRPPACGRRGRRGCFCRTVFSRELVFCTYTARVEISGWFTNAR